MLTRRRIIAGKIEATEGTAESITVSDAGILAIDPKFEATIESNARATTIATLSNPIPITGKRSARITFRAELKGPGASYSASVKPALGTYLRACGFAETVVAGTSVTYAPASAGVPSITLWLYEDGLVKKLKGARGNVRISGEVGGIMYADFEFVGNYDGVADLAIVSPTYEATVPPILQGATFTVDSYAAVIRSISLDMGNSLQLRESVASTTGHLSAVITARSPSGSIDPEATTVSAYNWYGKWIANNAGALSLGAVGSSQYNRYTITAPKVVYTGIRESSRSGIDVNEISFALAMNTGDDELSIQFT